MSLTLDRRSFLKSAGAASLLGSSAFAFPQSTAGRAMRAGTAKIDVTPTTPRVFADGRKSVIDCYYLTRIPF